MKRKASSKENRSLSSDEVFPATAQCVGKGQTYSVNVPSTPTRSVTSRVLAATLRHYSRHYINIHIYYINIV